MNALTPSTATHFRIREVRRARAAFRRAAILSAASREGFRVSIAVVLMG
jgi:hypothetical protein